MSETSASTGRPPGAPATADAEPAPRRWLILGLVGLAQLMIVLDLTVMNIALPDAQRALHFS
ncbi:MAG: MFS transporter, partial [Streptosporangiaceae bacterium]